MRGSNTFRNDSTVLAVSKVLITPFFSILRNLETGRDTSEKHITKSLDLQKIYKFDSRVFVVSPTVLKLQRFKKIGVINTLETAST